MKHKAQQIAHFRGSFSLYRHGRHLAANGLIHQGERVKPALDSTGTTTAVKYRALHRQERHTPLASFVAEAAARRQPECTFPRNSRYMKIKFVEKHLQKLAFFMNDFSQKLGLQIDPKFKTCLGLLKHNM